MGNEGSKKSAVSVGGLRFGDHVRVDLDVGVFKAMQQGHGGWNKEMEGLIGKVGRVHHFTSKKDVVIEFKESSKVWTMNARALTKVQKGENISTGDTVRICNNLQELKALQVGHGEWNKDMKEVLGKRGEVTRIYSSGDLRVTVNGTTWTINRLACTLVSQGSGEEGSPPEAEEEVDPRTALLTALFEQLLEQSVTPSSTDPDRLVHEAAQGNTDNVRQILAKHPGKVNMMAQGKSALHVACHEGHMDIVHLLLDADAQLGLCDDDGDAALTFTAYGNQPGVMKLLLSKGADTNGQNDEGVSALQVAVAKGNLACVRLLLEHRKCNINLQDASGDTALHDAISKDNNEVVSLLLKHPSINFTLENKKGFNVLQHAALHGNSFATEKILLNAPHIINARKDDGFSPLHLAALNNHTEVTTVLLKAEAFVDIPNKDGLTPLFLAVMAGDLEIAQLLLNHGASVHLTDKDGDTCLHFAALGKQPGAVELLMSTMATVRTLNNRGVLELLASRGDDEEAGRLVANLAREAATEEQPEMIKLLLKKGAPINAKNGKGLSPLHTAANKDRVASVKVLVEHRCDINIQDQDGDTPLHDAIRNENNKTLEVLITNPKVDYNLTNKKGFNCLHFAAKQDNNYATEKILAKAPWLVDTKKDDGYTALHLASLNGHYDLTFTLITKGKACLDMNTKDGETPLILAVSRDHARIVDLLIKNGANINATDKDGDTSLHVALMRHATLTNPLVQLLISLRGQSDAGDSLSIACYLCQKGADLHKTNNKGQTPMDLVHDTSLKATLLRYGEISSTQFKPPARPPTRSGSATKNPTAPPLDSPKQDSNAGEVERMQRRMEHMENDINCVICRQNPRSVAFMCGHTACVSCSNALTACHMCRTPITKKIKLFN